MKSVFDIKREIERGRERLQLEGKEQREKAEECVYREIVQDARKSLKLKDGMATLSSDCRNIVDSFTTTMVRLGNENLENLGNENYKIARNYVDLNLHLQERGWSSNKLVTIHGRYAHYNLE